jgi:hypothetical protein
VDAVLFDPPVQTLSDDAMAPDPADDQVLYPQVRAWLPARRSGRARTGPCATPPRMHDRGASCHERERGPAEVPQDRGMGFPAIEPERILLSASGRLSGGSVRETATAKPVSQSAFLASWRAPRRMTRCTMEARTASWGVEMQKSSFSSISDRSGQTAYPQLHAASGLSAVTQMSGFSGMAAPLTGERLSIYGARWLQALPVTVRPLITAKRHAHIVNKFAIIWDDADAVAAYFDELLISSRPGRRGFATEVLDELVELQRAVQERRHR